MEQKNEVLENVIRSLINTNNQVFITCHTRPDYDAIGASIGACLIAKKYKKKNYIVIDDEISSLSGVIGTKEIIEEITDQTRKITTILL